MATRGLTLKWSEQQVFGEAQADLWSLAMTLLVVVKHVHETVSCYFWPRHHALIPHSPTVQLRRVAWPLSRIHQHSFYHRYANIPSITDTPTSLPSPIRQHPFFTDTPTPLYDGHGISSMENPLCCALCCTPLCCTLCCTLCNCSIVARVDVRTDARPCDAEGAANQALPNSNSDDRTEHTCACTHVCTHARVHTRTACVHASLRFSVGCVARC
jgi:hypothetical protein